MKIICACVCVNNVKFLRFNIKSVAKYFRIRSRNEIFSITREFLLDKIFIITSLLKFRSFYNFIVYLKDSVLNVF